MENKSNTTEQPDKDRELNAINKDGQHVGRAGEEETHDISHVDRQEGSMNHGTLGGNFSIEEQSQNKQKDDENK